MSLRRPDTRNTLFRPATIGVLALTALAGCGSTGVVTAGPGDNLSAAAKRAGRDGIVKLDAGSYPAQAINTGSTGDCYSRRIDLKTQDCRTFLVPAGAKVRMGEPAHRRLRDRALGAARRPGDRGALHPRTLPGSDSRRYAACGDGVVANVAEWIGLGIAREDARADHR